MQFFKFVKFFIVQNIFNIFSLWKILYPEIEKYILGLFWTLVSIQILIHCIWFLIIFNQNIHFIDPIIKSVLSVLYKCVSLWYSWLSVVLRLSCNISVDTDTRHCCYSPLLHDLAIKTTNILQYSTNTHPLFLFLVSIFGRFMLLSQ